MIEKKYLLYKKKGGTPHHGAFSQFYFLITGTLDLVVINIHHGFLKIVSAKARKES